MMPACGRYGYHSRNLWDLRGDHTAGALTSWLRQELYRDAVEAEGHGGPDAYSVMAHDAADVRRVPMGSCVCRTLRGSVLR